MSFPKIKRYIIWTGALSMVGVFIALYKTNNLKYKTDLETCKYGDMHYFLFLLFVYQTSFFKHALTRRPSVLYRSPEIQFHSERPLSKNDLGLDTCIYSFN